MTCPLRTILIFVTFFLFSSNVANANQAKPQPKTIQQIVSLTNQYCGACHAPPSPQLLPKKSWPNVVKVMAEMGNEHFGTTFISPEHVRDITAYYYGSSPEFLPLLPYAENSVPPRVFKNAELNNRSLMPMITHINPVNLFKSNNTEFLISDKESNQVTLVTLSPTGLTETPIAELKIPSKTEVIDFDNDGDMDILVVEIGSFFPQRAKLQGQVVLLEQNANQTFTKHVLLDKVGRVTDIKAIDIDKDEDLDVAVAIFGADVEGELAWIENRGKLNFEKHTLLSGSGSLNITPIDLNNDGHMDFISLMTQQHELLAGLINQGNGTFKTSKLFQAGHPLVGFTSLQTVDLDGDKDLDLVVTNGDANDLQMDPKPYHGVQWFENKGNLVFQYHDIGRFYGAVSSAIGDIDNDGDLDIAVSSWNNYWDDPKRQSVIWFENNGQQQFTRHNLNYPLNSVIGLALADIDQDNYPELLVGSFRIELLKEQVNALDQNQTPTPNKTPFDRLVLFNNIHTSKVKQK